METASIDALGTSTEQMPIKPESGTPARDGAAFDEAVSRFQAAMGEVLDGLDLGSLGMDGDIEAPVAETGVLWVGDVKTPSVKVGDTGAADAEAGDVKTADVKVGDIKVPDAEVGDVKTTDVKVGDAKVPDVEVGDVKTADVKVGDTKAPAAEVVDVDAPDVEVADVDPAVVDPAVLVNPMAYNPIVDAPVVQQVVADTMKVAAVDSAESVRSAFLATAVEEVCEAIQVAPGVQPGQGAVRIQLKADVLSGTEVFLEAKGTTITVAFNPATADVAEILSRNITQFQQHLAGRIHNYQIAAKVKGLKS